MDRTMANIVTEETYNRMVAVGWTKPRADTDAQEIADELPNGIAVQKVSEGFIASWLHRDSNIRVLEADTLAEVLASLYLKLKGGRG